MKKKNLNIFFIIIFFILLFSIAFLNYSKDPKALLSNRKVIHPGMGNEYLYISMKSLKNEKIKTVILGSSDIGHLFSDECFSKNKLNVISANALSLPLLYEILCNYLEIYPNTKKVVIGISYMSLIEKNETNIPRYTGKHFNIKELSTLLFSLETTKRSLKIFYDELCNNNEAPENYSSIRPKLVDNLSGETSIGVLDEIRNESAEALAKFINLFKEREIEYTLIIPPYHAIYLSFISENPERQKNIEEFKRILVKMISNNVKIYDFAFINDHTTIDLLNDKDITYGTYNHPNSILGAEIYKILFEKRNKSILPYYILTKDNVDEVIAEQNRKLENYKIKNKKLINYYKELAKKQTLENMEYERLQKESEYSDFVKGQMEYINSLCEVTF